MSAEIENIEQRFHALEGALAGAAAGQFEPLVIEHDDPLAAIELGVNIVTEDLCAEIANTRETNRRLDERVAERTAELAEQLQYITRQNQLIRDQQEAIRGLSTPVLQLWDQVIAMPIIGAVDTLRSQQITEQLLTSIVAADVRFAILDLTGVEFVDTSTADHLAKVVSAAQLLGTTCILTGVRSAVAQTLVSLGVDVERVLIRRNLKEGLRACLLALNSENRGARSSDET